jgi:hypothetical protein
VAPKKTVRATTPEREDPSTSNVNKFAQYIDMINQQMSSDKKHMLQKLQRYYNENTKKYQNTMTNVKKVETQRGPQYVMDDAVHYNFVNSRKTYKTPDMKKLLSP